MPEVRLNINAVDKASSVIKGITGSIIKAGASIITFQAAAQVLGNVLQKGFEQASKSSGNFQTTLKDLKGAQEDIYKTAGKLIQVFGSQLAGGIKETSKAITDFLSNKDNISIMASVFSTLGSIVKDLIKILKDVISPIIQNIQDQFAKLTKETGSAVDQFTVFAGLVSVLKLSLGTMGAVISLIITAVVDLVIAFKNAGDTIGAFYNALTGKGSWDQVKKEAGETLKSIQNLGKNFGSNLVGVVNKVTNGLKELPKEIKNTADKYRTQSEKDVEAAKKNFIDAEVGKTEVLKTETKKQTVIVAKAKEQEKKTFKDYFSAIQGASENAFGSISQMALSFFDNQIKVSQMATEQQLSDIDTQTQAKLESLGLQDLSQSEQIAKDIADLQSQLTTETTMDDAKKINDLIREKQNELTKAKILQQAEDKKTAIKQEASKKEMKMKVDQFNAQKAIDLVTAGTQMALGIASAAASGAQFGPAAVAMIPILVGLVTAAGIASIAMIASKQPPAFAKGVTNFSGGVALVGEKGPELVTLPQGSNVFPNSQTQNMMGGINIQNMTVQSSDAQDFARQMIELRRYELARI